MRINMNVSVKKSSLRNIDIEILRAYSIVFVLFEHAGNITKVSELDPIRIFWTGWTGVDLFFAISGFVIYRSLSDRIHYGMNALDAVREIVAFWIRRFWRLAPAAWIWLAAGIPIIFLYTSAEVGTTYANFVDYIASIFNFQNFHRYYCNINHDVCGKLYPSYWSLSLETQFYIVLPFLIVFLRPRYFTLMMLLLIIVQMPIRRSANGDDIGWFIRTDALAWGVLISQLSISRVYGLLEPRFLSSRAPRIALAVLLLYGLGASQIFAREPFFVGFAAMLSGILVWIASYNQAYIARLLGAEQALVWLGERSYSLYLTHIVVFKATREICQAFQFYDFTNQARIAYLLLAYFAAFAMAAATYKWIETPLRRKGRYIAQTYSQTANGHDFKNSQAGMSA